MAIHPISSFPLLASDQADVIRIFLELMREQEPAGGASDNASSETLGSPRVSAPSRITGNLSNPD